MPLDKTIANAQAELEANRKWRAKEIIVSSLKNYDYHEDLFAFYGEILLSMNDSLQAGRYLFFSKENFTKEEQIAVDVFIERHSPNGYQGLIMNMPGKQYSYHLLPSHIQARLSHYGAPKSLFNDRERYQKQKHDNVGGSCLLICIVLLILVLTSMVIGFVTIIRWLFSF